MGNLASALSLQTEEAALIAELRAGSEQAFAWLITRYHQPIFSLLARTVQNRADAADLTQEVFVKIFRGVRNFHGESSLRTWIYRIALREASNQRRWWMRHRQQEVPIEQEINEGENSAPIRLKELLVDPGRISVRCRRARGKPRTRRGRAGKGAGTISHHAYPARHRGIRLRGSGGNAGRESWNGQIEAGARPRLPQGHPHRARTQPPRSCARRAHLPLGEEAR